MSNSCLPALIYVIFSLIQIIIDTAKGLYNTAIVKFIVMMLMTFLLNVLCQSGLSIISWIIVFVPFMFMSVIVGILLYVFGLDPSTGKIMFTRSDTLPAKDLPPRENKSGNLIFSNQPM